MELIDSFRTDWLLFNWFFTLLRVQWQRYRFFIEGGWCQLFKDLRLLLLILFWVNSHSKLCFISELEDARIELFMGLGLRQWLGFLICVQSFGAVLFLEPLKDFEELVPIISFVGINWFHQAKVDHRLLREIDWQRIKLLLLCRYVFFTLINAFISIV